MFWVLNSSAKISGHKILGGNATERALIEIAQKHINIDYSKVYNKIPFDSTSKQSSAHFEGKCFRKGAPEVLLSQIQNSNFDRFAVEYAISQKQSEGKRVIAMLENEMEKAIKIIDAVTSKIP